MVPLRSLLAAYEKMYGNTLSLHAEGDGNPSICHVQGNSREVLPGTLFCCIRGEKSDGHSFASDAADRGASAILAERILPLPLPQLLSGDVRRDMGRLAGLVYGNPASKLLMVAVTGTNGKSTTTYIIRHLLQSLGLRTGLLGTIVYSDGTEEWDAGRTTPESCHIQKMLALMVEKGCKCCVMETSSHGIALGRLEGCRFDGAVFTNLSEEHLDFHGTLESYFEIKSGLFTRFMKEGWSGAANYDDPFGRKIVERHPGSVIPYGICLEREDGVSARDILTSLSETRFLVSFPNDNTQYEVLFPLSGRFNVYNALGGISLVSRFSKDREAIIRGISTMEQVPGRLEKYFFENGVCCIIDFAHTPEALRNVLATLRGMCRGKIISVFGHGGERFQPNRFALGRIAASTADRVIITMDNPRGEDPAAIAAQIEKGVLSSGKPVEYSVILHRESAVRAALDSAKESDVVLLSGKGPEKYLHIGSEKIPYSDGEAVRKWAIERGLSWK